MELIVPARIGEAETARVRELAARAFRAIDGSGLARCDFFVRDDGEVLVNELNTIPGFTSTSVFAKLFEADGLSYPELCDRLVRLGVERYENAARLRVLSSIGAAVRWKAPRRRSPTLLPLSGGGELRDPEQVVARGARRGELDRLLGAHVGVPLRSGCPSPRAWSAGRRRRRRPRRLQPPASERIVRFLAGHRLARRPRSSPTPSLPEIASSMTGGVVGLGRPGRVRVRHRSRGPPRSRVPRRRRAGDRRLWTSARSTRRALRRLPARRRLVAPRQRGDQQRRDDRRQHQHDAGRRGAPRRQEPAAGRDGVEHVGRLRRGLSPPRATSTSSAPSRSASMATMSG